jgi:hypothetical protein
MQFWKANQDKIYWDEKARCFRLSNAKIESSNHQAMHSSEMNAMNTNDAGGCPLDAACLSRYAAIDSAQPRLTATRRVAQNGRSQSHLIAPFDSR